MNTQSSKACNNRVSRQVGIIDASEIIGKPRGPKIKKRITICGGNAFLMFTDYIYTGLA